MAEFRKPHDYIRPDLNIERWQIFATSQFKGLSRVLRRGDSAVIIGRVKDKRQEAGFREVGVFRIPEMKCFYALVKLWERAGKPWDRGVDFTLYEIAKILGMSWGGQNYRMIEEWLDRLKKIPIDWLKAYYQKDINMTESVLQSFTILGELAIYKRSFGKELAMALSSFKFHERILRNLLERNTKPLDLAVLLSLKKEISVLLYRHLDLVMADKNRYERNSAGLLAEDLQISGGRYGYPSRRAQVLELSFKELEGVELSTGVLVKARLEKNIDSSDWKGVFEKKPFPKRDFAPIMSKGDQAEVKSMVEDIIAVTEDRHSTAFFTKICRIAVQNSRLQELVYRCLGEIKEEHRDGLINTSRGAAFTDKLKRHCARFGIDLKLGEG